MRRMERLAVLPFLVLSFSPGVLAFFSATEVDVVGSGYAQFSYGSLDGSFEVEDVRLFVTGKVGSVDPLVELKLNQVDMLVKAQLSWEFAPAATVVLGQQSNPYKYYYPSPELNPMIRTPYARFIPAADDIGLSVKGRLRLIAYHLCLFNGTGRNRADENRYKDVVGRVQFMPYEAIAVAGCWQGGLQEDGWREGRAFDFVFRPFGGLKLSGAYLRRVDLNEDGWFTMLGYRLGNVQAVSRLARGTESGMTVGLNVFWRNGLKFQVNWVKPDEGEMELLARCQLSCE